MMLPKRLAPNPLVPAALVLVALAGCRENPVTSYKTPHESAPATGSSAPAPSGAMTAAVAASRLTWTAPASWVEKPASSMRLASYSAPAADGTEADVSVFSFPDAAGGLLANINRWRAQVGLAAVNAPTESATPTQVAGLQGWLLDLSGEIKAGASPMGATPSLSGPARMLGAIVPVNGTSWFFKMLGPESAVESQRGAFDALVASIRLETAENRSAGAPAADPHAGMTMPSMGPTNDPHAGLDMSGAMPPGGDPHAGMDMNQMAAAASSIPMPAQPPAFTFDVPAGWENQPTSAMRVASFKVPGQGVRDIDISVFALGGPAGGELANVNRWRGQLGLAPVDAAALDQSAVTVNGRGVKFRVFDIENATPSPEDGKPTRMLAAILPRGDRTWFVKMTGEAASVGDQRGAFVQYLQSFDFSLQPAP